MVINRQGFQDMFVVGPTYPVTDQSQEAAPDNVASRVVLGTARQIFDLNIAGIRILDTRFRFFCPWS